MSRVLERIVVKEHFSFAPTAGDQRPRKSNDVEEMLSAAWRIVL